MDVLVCLWGGVPVDSFKMNVRVCVSVCFVGAGGGVMHCGG